MVFVTVTESEPRAPTAYVAENSLVGAPVEGEALGPDKVGPSSAGECWWG